MQSHSKASIWSIRPKPGTRRPLSILLVDDHDLGAQALAAALSIDGHHVRVALNGAEALDALVLWTPEVAILDVNMPTPDGFELARWIRDRPATSGIYIIAHTSMEERDVRQRGVAAGIDAFCRKGAGVTAMLDIVSVLQSANR